MRRIGVGLDGSANSSAALEWAIRVAEATGAEILAINGFARPYSEMSPDVHERLVAERGALLVEQWTAGAVDAGLSVRTRVAQGDPRDVVLEAAEEESVDLLVLGRSGAGGGPGFMHIGSMVEYAAHHSSLPVAVIPLGRSGTIAGMVVGVDGSRESAGAVEWSASAARSLGSSVTAVYVEEPIDGRTSATSAENRRSDAEQRLEEWIQPLRGSDISVDSVVQMDLHPADGLLGVAAARHADLLVIGTRGLGGFTGLRAGGVALKVLHRARLPIVLVPPI